MLNAKSPSRFYLVDAKPSVATAGVVDMLAWQSHPSVASFVFHLANHASASNQTKHVCVNGENKMLKWAYSAVEYAKSNTTFKYSAQLIKLKSSSFLQLSRGQHEMGNSIAIQ